MSTHGHHHNLMTFWLLNCRLMHICRHNILGNNLPPLFVSDYQLLTHTTNTWHCLRIYLPSFPDAFHLPILLWPDSDCRNRHNKEYSLLYRYLGRMTFFATDIRLLLPDMMLLFLIFPDNHGSMLGIAAVHICHRHQSRTFPLFRTCNHTYTLLLLHHSRYHTAWQYIHNTVYRANGTLLRIPNLRLFYARHHSHYNFHLPMLPMLPCRSTLPDNRRTVKNIHRQTICLHSAIG